ncbi:MAG: type II toxin-antitoxin system RelE/ParE family toxin [Alphaproteobacteria bacterium]|nr:type II toxin-antitoxin system RelE/ParE family toxin [Alphaproteobacteria bacterium]
MTWRVEWDDRARKELRKLDHPVQKEILKYLRTRIVESKNPRLFGQNLSGNKTGLWRYRVEDYRLICRIEDDILVVLVVGVGHRKEVYES